MQVKTVHIDLGDRTIMAHRLVAMASGPGKELNSIYSNSRINLKVKLLVDLRMIWAIVGIFTLQIVSQLAFLRPMES